MPTRRDVAEVVIEIEYSLDLGPGAIERVRDQWHRRARDPAQVPLNLMQDGQHGAGPVTVGRNDGTDLAREVRCEIDGGAIQHTDDS